MNKAKALQTSIGSHPEKWGVYIFKYSDGSATTGRWLSKDMTKKDAATVVEALGSKKQSGGDGLDAFLEDILSQHLHVDDVEVDSNVTIT